MRRDSPLNVRDEEKRAAECQLELEGMVWSRGPHIQIVTQTPRNRSLLLDPQCPRAKRKGDEGHRKGASLGDASGALVGGATATGNSVPSRQVVHVAVICGEHSGWETAEA